MTYATHTDHGLSGTFLWQRLSGLKANLAERQAQRQAFRRTLSELSTMSDRDLTDIGVDRADIRAIARQAAYGA